MIRKGMDEREAAEFAPAKTMWPPAYCLNNIVLSLSFDFAGAIFSDSTGTSCIIVASLVLENFSDNDNVGRTSNCVAGS